MSINPNRFTLGDIGLVRDEKTGRCYRLDENGKKVRISNLDYEEYLEEAERREYEAEIAEVPKKLELPVNEDKKDDLEQDTESCDFYEDIGVKAGDNPVLLAQRIITALRNNRGVTLSCVGIRAVANATQAVRYTEDCLKCTVPCILNHKKFFVRDGRELDAISFIIYPEFTIFQQQNLLSTAVLNKIIALCKSYQLQAKESASPGGEGDSEADRNQLVFPWANGGENLLK